VGLDIRRHPVAELDRRFGHGDVLGVLERNEDLSVFL
jgi:hypothetical protein